MPIDEHLTARSRLVARRSSLIACLTCLALQALLLFSDLGHLPAWGDEYASLQRAGLAPAALVESLRTNVHPPLYSVLLRAWLALPLPGTPLLRARALSALLVLVATVVLAGTWLRPLAPPCRHWFLALWATSPALLLYGRMARSYSLQLLLAPLALWLGWRAVRHAEARTALAYGGVVTLLLYVHYLPGLAVLAAVGAAGLLRLWQQRDAAAARALGLPLVIVGVAYLPWLPELDSAVTRVSHGTGLHVFGDAWRDAAGALLYTALAFTAGEVWWWWTPLALPPLAVLLGALLWRALRPPPAWLGLVAVVAVVAFAGATRWVSVGFVAARLLFLLPFALLLLLRGGTGAPRLRAVACGTWLAVSLAGVAAYASGRGFLNQAYVIPADAIAAAVAGRGEPAPRLVLDHYNINLSAVLLDLPATTRVVWVSDAASAARAADWPRAEPDAHLWFAHSLHDASPQQWNRAIERAWQARCPIVRQRFAPYSDLERTLMRVAGRREPPTHAVELIELRCPPQREPAA
ncbi:MAG: hypothetical protein SF182_27515 [Deltaproteobacteria bacterium]|nr:hypothetical protein [Deltaproteobacteria bacterium]